MVDSPGLQWTVLHGQENEDNQTESPGNGGKYYEINHCCRVQEIDRGQIDEATADNNNNDDDNNSGNDEGDNSFF